MTDLKEDHRHPFNSRLEEFRKHLNLKSKRAFYDHAKIDSSQFFRVTNGFQKPGFRFIEKLAIAFPDLNLSWLLIGEGEMILDRVDDAEKTILENYRKLPEDEKNEFEVKTSLFGKEVSERKQLAQNIIKNEVVESINRFQGELKEKLELLNRLRSKFFQGLKEEENSLAVAMYGIDEVKKQYQEIESEIQKLVSLDSDYIKEFLAEINKE
tara:strand:- start:199 stop:831 length:633 start_codon:yes stop_codon:yes gene_type:complete